MIHFSSPILLKWSICNSKNSFCFLPINNQRHFARIVGAGLLMEMISTSTTGTANCCSLLSSRKQTVTRSSPRNKWPFIVAYAVDVKVVPGPLHRLVLNVHSVSNTRQWAIVVEAAFTKKKRWDKAHEVSFSSQAQWMRIGSHIMNRSITKGRVASRQNLYLPLIK